MTLPRINVILGLVTVVSLQACSIRADDTVEASEVFPIVITKNGPVQGIKEFSTLGKEFHSFYGIPFARPPIGNLRLKDPIPVQSWEETLDASTAPPACMQIGDQNQQKHHDVHGEEDCLYLNIFTPVNPNNITRERAVMIFIHFGGFLVGSASVYSPHIMMNEDIVMVVIQYRLGALGFMSTEDSVMSGNYGLKDQTLALKWVQENIPKFGGNSLQITLSGQSAGASSVHLQILSPKSTGLFHQAILQSGTALSPWTLGTTHRSVAKNTGALFNCSSAEGDNEVTVSKKLAQCFNHLEASDLVDVAREYMVWESLPKVFVPRVDGDFLPQAPETLIQNGRFQRIPMMSGVSSHDGSFLSLRLIGHENSKEAVQHDFRTFGPVLLNYSEGDVDPIDMSFKMFDHYIGGLTIDESTADNITRMLTDRNFAHSNDLTTTLHARTVPPISVFRYQFSYRGQYSVCADAFAMKIGKHWVCHMDEMHYLLEGGLYNSTLETEDDLKMSAIMTKLWSNFATYGHPTFGENESLNFTWDPVSAGNDNYQYLDITLEPAMKPDTRKVDRDFLLHLPTRQNHILFPEIIKTLKIVLVEDIPEENKPQPKKQDKQYDKGLEN